MARMNENVHELCAQMSQMDIDDEHRRRVTKAEDELNRHIADPMPASTCDCHRDRCNTCLRYKSVQRGRSMRGSQLRRALQDARDGGMRGKTNFKPTEPK